MVLLSIRNVVIIITHRWIIGNDCIMDLRLCRNALTFFFFLLICINDQFETKKSHLARSKGRQEGSCQSEILMS